MRHRPVVAVAASAMLLGIFPGVPAGALDEPPMRVIETLSIGVPRRGASAAATAVDPGEAPFCSTVTRSEVDRDDIHDGSLVHVIYIVPRDAEDEHLDANGTLACSVLAQNNG